MKKIKNVFLFFCFFIGGVFIFSALSSNFDFISHEHSYSATVTAPTCTENGYTTHKCSCGDKYVDSYVDATGHNYAETIIEPTCAKEGYTAHVCECGDSYTDNVIPALDHTPVSDSPIEANCEHTGLTAGSHCSVCGEIIERQSLIEKAEHRDINHDGYCDNCLTHFENVIEISNAEELKSINDNLSGSYRLTTDVSLVGHDFAALGSLSKPFTGKLYGMNHSVVGFSLANCDESGLFVCNKGTIDGVILKDLSLSLKDISGTVGGIAAYNYGTIKNCSVTGNTLIDHSISHSESSGDGVVGDTVITYTGSIGILAAKNNGTITDCVITGNVSVNNTVYFYQSTKYPKYDGKTVAFTGTYGEICAVNEGVISNCALRASCVCQFNNEIKYTLKPNKLYYMENDYDAECNVSVYFGGIGKNSGTVENCTVTGANDNTVKVSAKYDKHGVARATSYVYIGSLVGVNDKTIKNCHAEKSTIVSDVGKSNVTGSTTSGYKGLECTLRLFEDSTYKGVIGDNRGNVY